MSVEQWQHHLTDLLTWPENNLISAAMQTGKIPVGYTCSYVPKVLLSLGKLIPVRVRAPGVTGTEIADIYLSNVTCSYSRSLLEAAMDGHYDFLGGWVFAAGCDHIRRVLDNLDYIKAPEFTHMVDVPHRDGKQALAWYVEELKTLCEKLASRFGVDTGTPSIQAAIQRQNHLSQKIQAMADLRKRQHPPISGTQFQTIMQSSLVIPDNDMEQELDRFMVELHDRPGISNYRARLMVAGGCIDDTGFIQLIESAGGLVVADRFCTGSLPGLSLIPEEDDPLRAIAAHTLSTTSCPRMMEGFQNRLQTIIKLRDEYDVDGIVVEHIKFCDLWGIETGLLVNALREKGIPVLRLERDYRLSNDGQLRTRIQAFLESMRR